MSQPICRVSAERPSFEEVVRLDELGFSRPRTPESDLVAASVLSKNDVGFVARDAESGQAEGYGLFRVVERPEGRVLYAGAIITNPNYRRGVGRSILAAASGAGNYAYLAFSTQSPAMYAAGCSLAERLYPALDGSPSPVGIAKLAKALLGETGYATYPIRPALYEGRPLYGARPVHSLAEQFYAFPGLDYENGDALFCIGTLARQGREPAF